jgi:hypothetical protein
MPALGVPIASLQLMASIAKWCSQPPPRLVDEDGEVFVFA